jgi:hypothetical protein
VPVLRLQAEDKTKEPEVQGKAQGAECGLAIITHRKRKDPAAISRKEWSKKRQAGLIEVLRGYAA